jgi:hypothetical protein
LAFREGSFLYSYEILLCACAVLIATVTQFFFADGIDQVVFHRMEIVPKKKKSPVR